MPNLVGPQTIDTQSSDGTCIYNAAPIGGTPIPTTVVINKQPLFMIAGVPSFLCAPPEPATKQRWRIPLRPVHNMDAYTGGT